MARTHPENPSCLGRSNLCFVLFVCLLAWLFLLVVVFCVLCFLIIILRSFVMSQIFFLIPTLAARCPDEHLGGGTGSTCEKDHHL